MIPSNSSFITNGIIDVQETNDVEIDYVMYGTLNKKNRLSISGDVYFTCNNSNNKINLGHSDFKGRICPNYINRNDKVINIVMSFEYYPLRPYNEIHTVYGTTICTLDL